MQQGDRMQLNRLKMAIQYRQKKVSQDWKSLKCASITNFILSFKFVPLPAVPY